MTEPRPRLRQLGPVPGLLEPGPLNAITDVAGVLVGHETIIEGDAIRTGVTAIRPHPGNVYQERIPAGIAVGNGYGKLMGSTQLRELGEIETPILLTNTLAVPRAAEALLDWTLTQPGNENVFSVNPLVGECNDAFLNDIRRRVVQPAHGLAALRAAASGPVAEGCVGAGTGTLAFHWKGGIGTSSRRLPDEGAAGSGAYTVGALVQANFGGLLLLLGRPLLPPAAEPDARYAGGSIIMILATDAPLSDRDLTRLARRALGGLARTGANLAHHSGDYAIAFSTAPTVRRRPDAAMWQHSELPSARLTPLFVAAIESTAEAIWNAMLAATDTTGYKGRTAPAIPLSLVREAIAARP